MFEKPVKFSSLHKAEERYNQSHYSVTINRVTNKYFFFNAELIPRYFLLYIWPFNLFSIHIVMNYISQPLISQC